MAIKAKLIHLGGNPGRDEELQAAIVIPLTFEKSVSGGEFKRIDPLADTKEWLGLIDEIIERGEFTMPLDRFCVHTRGKTDYFWVAPDSSRK